MKILALSDTGFTKNSTKEYERIVDRFKPEVLVLAGDYDEVLFFPHDPHKYILDDLRDQHKHVLDYFYQFLEYCSKSSYVLVIRGNHETKGLYSPERINSIPRCRELSDCKVVEVKGTSFLGIGYLKKLLPIIKRLEGQRIDVIITHCDKARIPVLTRLNPKLIIHGHAAHRSRPSRYSVNHIPVISTGSVRYSVISFYSNRRAALRILQYKYPVERWITRQTRDGGFMKFLAGSLVW